MFNKPDRHPYDLLGNYEKESFMAWFLTRCFDTNDLDAVIALHIASDIPSGKVEIETGYASAAVDSFRATIWSAPLLT